MTLFKHAIPNKNSPKKRRAFWLKNVCAFLFLAISLGARAERYIPASPDEIIASWPTNSSPALQQAQAAKHLRPTDPATVVTLANNYLALAAMPGQSRLYGLAQAALKPLIDANTQNAQIWLAWAQVLQHQHAFDESLNAIAKVTATDPKNINANLLAARIYLIQDKPIQAKQSCIKLLGYSDLLTTSACVLEITGHQPEKLQESYTQLIAMVKREGFPSDERGPWLAQVLADMAMRLQDPKAASDWLAHQLTTAATVNYLAQWADTEIAQGHNEKVLTYLTPIVTAAAEMDDLLLLQLAIAEKNNSNSTHWRDQLAERIALREQRQDSQHANELARFYLDVNPQPEKALYWAMVHYKNSRETADKELLSRAQTAAGRADDLSQSHQKDTH